MKPEELSSMAKFRKLGRIPSICYAHSGTDGKMGTGCSIWRSSEPTFSLYQKGSLEDRRYFIEMAKLNTSSD